MSQSRSLLALDIGEVRIGVALATSAVRIAIPSVTLTVDGGELRKIATLVATENVDTIVIGYPRNQSGETTQQTVFVERFAAQLVGMVNTIVFQDESLTSVIAEQRLVAQGKPFTKGDIDAEAATIILQDYMEQRA